MIVDADCHISPTPEGGTSITVEELLRRMDRAGVDKALTWLHRPYRREIDGANAYVFYASKRYPERILGFGWADPNLGMEKAVLTVRQCIEEYGFYGVKLNGAENEFFIDDPKLAFPVIEEIAAHGSRLALYVGPGAPERTHPFRVAKIAAHFPDLPILIVHMGGDGPADLSNILIDVAQQHPNLTLVGSDIRDIPLLKAIGALGASRVCFGSNTPFTLMHVEMARYRALLDGEIDDDDKRLIMGGNITRLLGVSASPQKQAAAAGRGREMSRAGR
jgi:predicted TIM-barrel fold metal-dependent hydrolase